ncbi:MAG TPA: LssY C-terminal domain-containing protein [Nocardioidaceae bacterium]|nr:LssY C-terminal domain-containing protein [Nocardioidaceae bacterium]
MDPNRGAHSPMTLVDALLFVYAGLSAVWLAYLVLAESFQLNWQLVLLLVFWMLVAYLVLPRLHRVLTYLYVPGYFIGRTRTSDGLLGDPVNLALLGNQAQVHAAMSAAGWTLADDVTLASSLRIIRTTLARRTYPEAPVSPLYLFERQQDFAYQQEVEGNPSQRHHVRFWRCPEDWRLPGGYPVDWVAAGTYDRSVGLSLMTLQVTHRIARNIDVERDHIVATITGASPGAAVDWIRHFASGYHARNGGGDEMVTDGHLPVVDLRQVQAPGASERLATESREKRPAATSFSAGVACLRGLVGLVLAFALFANPDATALAGGAAWEPAIAAATATALLVVAVLDIGLGLATYLGRNWARVLLMLSCAATIVVAFIATATGAPRPTLGTGLPHVALGILVLLALTSPGARQYATRASRT